MKDDYTNNSHYLIYFRFKVGTMSFLNLRVKFYETVFNGLV